MNAFNQVAALNNISVICLPLSQILSTYRAPIRMIIPGDGEILSAEGGDLLAMAMYALALTLLIHQLLLVSNKCGLQMMIQGLLCSCTNLKSWGCKLLSCGPALGYYSNASKTYLVVKEEQESSAREHFAGTGVNITVMGKRHLRAAIGSRIFTKEYVCKKVNMWTDEIKKHLAEVATSQPQAAYTAFTHGLTSHCTYLLKTIPDIQGLLIPLKSEILHSCIN